MIPNGNYLKLLSYFKQMRKHNVWDKIKKYTRAVQKDTELFFFNLLLYLQLNQTCLLQSTPLYC